MKRNRVSKVVKEQEREIMKIGNRKREVWK
jgi:hypothetical protein